MVFNLHFAIDGFNITAEEKYTVPVANRNYVFANFTFSDEWTALDQFAIFVRDAVAVKVPLVAGQCRVPTEILVAKGKVNVGVIAGDRAVTIAASFTVGDSIFQEAEPPEPPTPDYEYVTSPVDAQVVLVRYFEGGFQFFANNQWHTVGAGPGVPAGGDVDQVLAKRSAADFDTHWVDPTGGGSESDIAWLPSVSAESELSWTRSSSTTPPVTRNIKGAPGDPGSPGAAATVAVGSVTTTAPGTAAAITNVGTPEAAVFNFSIPRGDVGPAGGVGPTGPTGEIGPQGERGPAGVTPVRGVDYWTAADIEYMVQETLSRVVDGNEVAF